MIDGETDPLEERGEEVEVLDDAGSSEFGSDESNDANVRDELALLNEEADVPLDVIRARYAMDENNTTTNTVPTNAVSNQQQRPESTDGSLISAPSPTTVQKEGRSTEKKLKTLKSRFFVRF